ncbi:hypothetical protein [Hydrococcus rivularis]|uniref:hypothetical protein n=1 Tax=Hydrococcus rivularis TaxID=1616834 RepID=UPI000ACB4B71|nr:hypothetical protein [Hydrococcus rivularis]
MTEIVDCPHPQPLFQFGRGEKDVDRENLKIGIKLRGTVVDNGSSNCQLSPCCPYFLGKRK